MISEIRDECGVFGIYAPDEDVVTACYRGLFALQHRGQESCGIVVNDRGRFLGYKDAGLVGDVFTRDALLGLGGGQAAIAHVRYGASDTDPRLNAQPLVVDQLSGVTALAHSGRLINAYELRGELERQGLIFHTASNAEIIAYLITRERLTASTLEAAVTRAAARLRGAYTLVVMDSEKLIAMRDPLGIRPLCIGTVPGGYMVASESCALDAVDARFLRDVEPGEMVVIDASGLRSDRTHVAVGKKAMCAFEYIYFARPDSVIDGASVHQARLRAGAFLAEEHPVEADVVVGVPDSGIDAAIGFSKRSGIPYDVGFIKNKYIGRTFIAPGQSHRRDMVQIKLNVVPDVARGKRVVIIEDSIVRGTTSAPIIKKLREAGATEVHMRVASPPYVNPCYYGTDIKSRENLIACRHSVDEIAQIIGADSLGYLSIENARRLAGDAHFGFCDACFTGQYPAGVPSEAHTRRMQPQAGEGNK